MDYQKHYDVLIERSKTREIEGYTEKHHIIPKCMNGSDKTDNLVKLTAREHFIAHLLLMRIYHNNYKMVYAVQMMCVIGKNQEDRINNRMYGWLKKRFSQSVSLSQSGKGNSQYGKMWISHCGLHENKKIYKDDVIPDGWIKGRWKWLSKPKKAKLIKKKKKKVYQFKVKPFISSIIKTNRRNLEKVKNNSIYAHHLMDMYKYHDFKSIRQFCKSGFYDKSHVMLTVLWKKYIPNYGDIITQGKSTKLVNTLD